VPKLHELSEPWRPLLRLALDWLLLQRDAHTVHHRQQRTAESSEPVIEKNPQEPDE